MRPFGGDGIGGEEIHNLGLFNAGDFILFKKRKGHYF